MLAPPRGVVLSFAALAVQSRRNRSPIRRRLFNELCDGHELGREERDLLELIGEARRLDPLAKIFLEPDRLTDPKTASCDQPSAVAHGAPT